MMGGPLRKARRAVLSPEVEAEAAAEVAAAAAVAAAAEVAAA